MNHMYIILWFYILAYMYSDFHSEPIVLIQCTKIITIILVPYFVVLISYAYMVNNKFIIKNDKIEIRKAFVNFKSCNIFFETINEIEIIRSWSNYKKRRLLRNKLQWNLATMFNDFILGELKYINIHLKSGETKRFYCLGLSSGTYEADYGDDDIYELERTLQIEGLKAYIVSNKYP